MVNSTAMADEKLRVELRDGVKAGDKVMVLEGVLNLETAFQFRDQVRGNEADTMILDMSGVRSMDSSGLGAIVGAYVSYDRNCRRLLLAGTNDRIWDVFRTCRLTDVFTRYHTVADAEQLSTAPVQA